MSKTAPQNGSCAQDAAGITVQISAGTCPHCLHLGKHALPCAFDWLLQPVCLILQPHRVAVPFPPSLTSPWRNSFVQFHGGTTSLKAKFGTTPPKRLKNDQYCRVGSLGRAASGTNKLPLLNPSFSYHIAICHAYRKEKTRRSLHSDWFLVRWNHGVGRHVCW